VPLVFSPAKHNISKRAAMDELRKRLSGEAIATVANGMLTPQAVNE